MRKGMAVVLLLGSGLLMQAGVLKAQLAEVAASFGRSVSPNSGIGQFGGFGGFSQTLTIDNTFRLAGRLALNNWNYLGHELGYGYERNGFNLPVTGSLGTITIHQFFYDFLAYAQPRGSRIRPFICAGIGFSSFFPPPSTVFPFPGETRFGPNFGAGLKARLGRHFGVRVDGRDYLTSRPFGLPQSAGKLNDIEISGGLSFSFGGA